MTGVGATVDELDQEGQARERRRGFPARLLPAVSSLCLNSYASLRKLRKMEFEILGEIIYTETIAVGKAIRELPRLRRQYGAGRWRKLKRVATIRLSTGRVRQAELHWYEAHGMGRKEFKRKRYLD
jgi:hypothetical protein